MEVLYGFNGSLNYLKYVNVRIIKYIRICVFVVVLDYFIVEV